MPPVSRKCYMTFQQLYVIAEASYPHMETAQVRESKHQSISGSLREAQR